ncbi:unnamed protein product, partial [marine sediment metagenome]
IGLVHFDDEDLIATLQVSFAGTFAQGGGPASYVREFDMQGADGYGYLFAGKVLYLGMSTGSQSENLFHGSVMLLYRLVQVTAAELIGLASESTPI